MKGKSISVLSMLLIAALLTSTLAFVKPASAAFNMYVDPAANNYTTSTAYVGKLFNVSIKVTDVPATPSAGNPSIMGAGAWQFQLQFDDSILNVTRWYEPSFDATYLFWLKTTSALPSPPDPGYVHLGPSLGRVQVSASLFPAPPSQNGSSGAGPFILAILTFNVTALPAKLGSLSSSLHFSGPDSFLLDVDGNTMQPTLTDGSYSLVWAAPAPVNLAMGISQATFDASSDWVGATTTVTASINPSAAWFLSQAQFDLTWNATVIDVVGGLANITIDANWAGPNIVTIGYVGDQGTIHVDVQNPIVNPPTTIATIVFTVMTQMTAPPQSTFDYDVSPLTYSNVFFFDHVGPVPVGTVASGEVKVFAHGLATYPWFQVIPTHTVLGPDPSIGDLFSVAIQITGQPPKGLDAQLRVIGAQFRMYFDDSIITPLAINEGPFFHEDAYSPYGTFFSAMYEPVAGEPGPYSADILVGTLILPNGSGVWDQTSFANGTGTIATVDFMATAQECPNPFKTNFTLTGVFGQWLIDVNGNYVPVNDTMTNNPMADYTMLPFDQPGRVIDLYGAAKNEGYWAGYPAPFPFPYGGQGPNHWMDLALPQTEITLYGNVTYNYWPVQQKDVGFEIEGPFVHIVNQSGNFYVPRPRYSILAKLTATTGVDGIATLTFRMPWPCDDPDGITGIYKVTATVTVADVVVNDTMYFYYERAVYITSVTTDSFYYIHGDIVKVTVNYQTHMVRTLPALFSVVITDDLGVPFGMALVATTVGGATFCTWKTGSFTVEIPIPKYAYAGYGHVHVNVYDKDPTEGGEAWAPEFTPAPTIQIGPY